MSYGYANRGRKPSRDWSKVDWSKSSRELAEMYNMTVSNISRVRGKFAPKTLKKSGGKEVKYKVDWFMVDWSKTTKQISEEIGCSGSTVSIKRREFAPQTLAKRVFLNI